MLGLSACVNLPNSLLTGTENLGWQSTVISDVTVAGCWLSKHILLQAVAMIAILAACCSLAAAQPFAREDSSLLSSSAYIVTLMTKGYLFCY